MLRLLDLKFILFIMLNFSCFTFISLGNSKALNFIMGYQTHDQVTKAHTKFIKIKNKLFACQIINLINFKKIK